MKKRKDNYLNKKSKKKVMKNEPEAPYLDDEKYDEETLLWRKKLNIPQLNEIVYENNG